MELCVGAVTRIVVQEATKIGVPQIIASRRQVNDESGYIDMRPRDLVDWVRNHGTGRTKVVRDHGGPGQGETSFEYDDWVSDLDHCVDAGFDVLHLDVSKLPRDVQRDELTRLVAMYESEVEYEIGGERDDQTWLDVLMGAVLQSTKRSVPTHAIVDLGGHIFADRQCGSPIDVSSVRTMTSKYHELGIMTKAHNMDWVGGRRRYDRVLDAYNIAPELAAVEIDAWLHALPFQTGQMLLILGWKSGTWRRWFGDDEGTWLERARCGTRYVLETDEARELLEPHRDHAERYVRERVRDAIISG